MAPLKWKWIEIDPPTEAQLKAMKQLADKHYAEVLKRNE